MRSRASGRIVMLEQFVPTVHQNRIRESQRAATGPVEIFEDDEPVFDHLFRSYAGKASPGDLKAVNVLFETFALEAIEREGRDIVSALRTAFGAGRVLWTIEWRGDAFTWRVAVRDTSIEAIARSLSGRLEVAVPAFGERRWGCTSLELGAGMMDRKANGLFVAELPTETAPFYVEHEIDASGPRLAAVVTIHSAIDDPDALIGRIKSSPHVAPTRLADVLWPQLFDLGPITVASGCDADSICYSRLSHADLLFFVKSFGWPSSVTQFLDTRRRRLAHARWDAGFHYRRDTQTAITQRFGSFLHGVL